MAIHSGSFKVVIAAVQKRMWVKNEAIKKANAACRAFVAKAPLAAQGVWRSGDLFSDRRFAVCDRKGKTTNRGSSDCDRHERIW